MSDDQLVEYLAATLWGLNLDRDAHSIARDLVPVVRQVAPQVAPRGRALQLVQAGTPHPTPCLNPHCSHWGRQA